MTEEKSDQLTIPQISAIMCAKCRKKLVKLLKDRMDEQVIRKLYGI